MQHQRNNTILLPGFVDLHVHFREPGFSYKETIATGSTAALRGGYIAVVTMPNLKPAPDSLLNLQQQLDLIKLHAQLPVIPTGSITMGQLGAGELSCMEEMAPHVCGFSDDGVGVNDAALMKEAMLRAKKLGKPIIAHCEDLSFGDAHNSASEYKALERDLQLAAQTGCHYHVCHVSAKESVELIRQAKKDGVAVTAETAPHYLVLCDADVLPGDGNYKMNPPIRGKADQTALLEGLIDGTIDCIATDHAPHTAQDKLNGCPGLVGLETAFPVLYTKLVREGVLTLDHLVNAMAHNPRELLKRWTSRVFGGSVLWDIQTPYVIDPNSFATMGHATPFAGWEVFGQCLN
ncbi:MAG: dihydroorotase [Oscillospiraceae bacterium]|nr:dihydroorotase [Oscillospiraceae bacterium]